MFDRRIERCGDAGDVLTELAGPVGFPLCDGAAADAAGDSQGVLREAAGAAESTDAGADRFGLERHQQSVGEKD